jgi:ABC-type amino acid transport substrate-binding protein
VAIRSTSERATAGPRRAGARRIVLPLLAAILLGLCLGLAGCAGLGPGAGGVLRVGTAANYPPVVFEHEGEIVGIEAELAHRLGEAIGRRIEFVRIPFVDLIDALEAGEVDVVMSGLSVTPERAERVRFTMPYMQIGQLALIRSADLARFGRIQRIRRSGTRVGFERGTTGERFVANELPSALSFAFDSVEDGLRSLRAGRIDYFVHDAPTVWRIAADLNYADLHGLFRPLTEESVAWAVRRDDVALANTLDATLARWKQEGLIEPIVQHWIPVRITQH